MTTTETIHRALIIAAGMGSRLKHHTQDIPKCMVQVHGKSILSYQLDALKANGIDDIHIVRGYLADRLLVDSATYYDNVKFRDHNILFSAMFALEAFDQPLVTTYSDIIYTPDVVATLLNTPGDIVLTVDANWDKVYEGRDLHPIEQAELTEVDDDGNVMRVGKWVGPERTIGEFIGLAKYSSRGAQLIRDTWEDLLKRYNDDDPFHNATLFRKAYLTDLFEEIIARGYAIRVAIIHGGWREIDTTQDLKRANILLEGSLLT